MAVPLLGNTLPQGSPVHLWRSANPTTAAGRTGAPPPRSVDPPIRQAREERATMAFFRREPPGPSRVFKPRPAGNQVWRERLETAGRRRKRVRSEVILGTE